VSDPRPDPRSVVLDTVLPSFTAVAEREQLQAFARITGLDDPVYREVDAARRAGFPDLLVPPTFLFSLELRRPEPYAVLDALGVPQSSTLHGEQSFEYHLPAFAGQALDLAPRLTDYYEKKGGALRFVVRTTTVHAAGDLVANLTNVLVIRDGS